MMWVLTVLLVLLWIALVRANPARALGVVVFALPSYLIRLSLMGLPTTVLEILIVSFCGVILIAQRHHLWRHLTRLWADMGRAGQIASALFVIASCVGVVVAPHGWAALGLWRAYVVEPIVFVICAYPYMRSAPARRFMAQGGLALLIILTALALYQYATGNFIPYPWWQAGDIRATGVFDYPNALTLLVVPLAFLVGAWGGGVVAVIAGICALMCCVFAQSVGGMVALGAGGIIIGLLYKKTRVFVGGVLVIAVIVALVWQPLHERIITEATLRGDSGPVRQIIWGNTVAMLRDHPLLGVGFGGYREGVTPYHREKHIEIYQYPHNSILTVWSEMGALGVIAYHGLLGWGICMLWCRARRDVSRALLVGVYVAVAVHGLVDVPYFKNDLALLWWIMIATTVAQREQKVSQSI